MRKNLCRFVALAVAVLLLMSTGVVTMAEEAADGKTVVRIMTYWGEQAKHDGIDKLIEAVEALHPEYDFQANHMTYDSFWIKIKTEIMAENPPAIVAGRARDMVELIDQDKFIPLTNYEWIKNYSDEMLLESWYKDDIWNVPLDMGFSGIYYRKEMFREVLGTDEPPKTHTEFVEMLKKFRDAGIVPFAFGGAEADPCKYTMGQWLDQRMAFEAPNENYDIIRGEKTFADSKVYRDYFIDIYNDFIPNIDPSDMGISRERSYDMFLSQERPMTIHGTFNIGTFRKGDPDADIGIFPVPLSDDPEENMVCAGTDNDLMIINGGDPDVIKGAEIFLEYMTSEEGLSIWAAESGCLPGSDLVKGEDSTIVTDPMADYCFELYNTGKYYNLGEVKQWPGAMSTERDNMMQKFLQDGVEAYANGVDAEEFVDAFLVEMDTRMSEFYEQYIDNI